MNRYKTHPSNPQKLDTGLIFRIAFLVAMLAAAAAFYVAVKIQQHTLGEQSRQIEAQIAEIRNYTQVLRSEISTATSHSSISQAMLSGKIALVAISDQFVARLAPPSTGAPGAQLGTASALPPPAFRP